MLPYLWWRHYVVQREDAAGKEGKEEGGRYVYDVDTEEVKWLSFQSYLAVDDFFSVNERKSLQEDPFFDLISNYQNEEEEKRKEREKEKEKKKWRKMREGEHTIISKLCYLIIRL